MSEWTVQALVATSILMALVLALRGPVARAFGPTAAYALWALPALRMVMPSLPGWHALYVPVWHMQSHHSVVGLVDPVHAAMLDAPGAPPAPLAPPALIGPVMVETIHWPTILMAIWLTGALVWFGWQMLRYRNFLRGALRSATLLTTECGVDVLLTDAVDGPVAAGILHKRIFLPADFMRRYGPRERRLALLHEGAHHDRRDILANLVALAVLAVHWWNPLAHRAYRRFRADQELACDATVLAGLGGDDRRAYGSAVLKSASARMPGVACALSHKDELKRRLQEMARKPLGSPRQWAGIVVALAATLSGLVVTASGHATTPGTSAMLTQADYDEIEADAKQARAEALQARAEAEQSRREALAAAAEARHDGQEAAIEAQREATRAQVESRRAAAQARVEAQQARAEADRSRAEADRSRGDALAAAAEARRDAENARREGLAAAAEARREAARARDEALREAARDRAQAQREAAQARADAQRDAAKARRDALREAADARRDAAKAREQALRDADRNRRSVNDGVRQISLVRQRMAGDCAARGRPVSAETSFSRLALCGDSVHDIADREIAFAFRVAGWN